MRIGLITIHFANSYGGNLQAFSTQKVLSKFGSVHIINYRCSFLSKTMKLFRVSADDFVPRDILRMGKDLFRLFPRYKLLKKFRKFSSEYMELTEPFNNISEISILDNKFDAFVTGSDQIWNPDVVGKLDPVYFLDFVRTGRKVSFASSAGSHKFTDQEKSALISSFKSFSEMSVRESDTAEFLTELLGRPVTHVLDPTLMLNKQEWLDSLRIVQPKVPPQKYLLVYTLTKDDLVRSVVKQVAVKSGLKVIAIDQDPYLGYPVDNHIMDASPRDFVELFSGAAMVVTNSFHGTTFAMNFSIPFIAVKPETGLNRIDSFLRSVGLSKRLVQNVGQIDTALNDDVTFTDAHNKLIALRQSSFEFLRRALLPSP